MKRKDVRARARIAGGLAVLLTMTSVGPILGQSAGGAFRLVGQTVGGGGVSQGGAYSLRGGILTPSGGRSEGTLQPGGAGLDFQLVGGTVIPSGTGPIPVPKIRAILTADKLAELSWDMDIEGYVLEFSNTTGPGAVWQAVNPQPVGRSFTTPCAQPARFFRLRER